MRELGQEDAICRNYDLTFYIDRREPGMEYSHVRSACEKFGIPMDTKSPLKLLIDEVRARLRNMGYAAGTDDQLQTMLNEWYIWDRIRTGSLRSWRKKAWMRGGAPAPIAGDNPLLD